MIVYFVVLGHCSIMLTVGVTTDIRGLIIPWLIVITLGILFPAAFGLWFIFGYYIYLEVVFVALCLWLWIGLNIYCWYVVRSHYRNVKMFQSPDIEYLDLF